MSATVCGEKMGVTHYVAHSITKISMLDDKGAIHTFIYIYIYSSSLVVFFFILILQRRKVSLFSHSET